VAYFDPAQLLSFGELFLAPLTGQARAFAPWSAHSNAGPVFSPSFRKMMAAGQNPVKAAWSMLAPTKTVRSSQYGLTSHPSATLTRIMLPANVNTARSTFTAKLLQIIGATNR